MRNARIVLMLGSYVAGGRPVNVVDDDWNSPRFQWGRRTSGFFAPDKRLSVFAWMHERLLLPIRSVERNQPQVGDTRITLGLPQFPNFQLPRLVGDVIRIKPAATGIAEWDAIDHLEAEVTQAGSSSTPPILVIRGHVPAAGALQPSAHVLIGYAHRYHGDDNSHVDATFGGTFPSTTWGPDYRAMQVLQDHFAEAEPDDLIILVKVATDAGLRSRRRTQDPRWLPEFELTAGKSDGTVLPVGSNLSLFAETKSILRDVLQFLRGNVGILPANTFVTQIVMGFGLHEGSIGNAALARVPRQITGVAVDAGSLIVTTATAHNVPAKTPDVAYPVAIISGLANDPDRVGGRLREIEPVDATRIRIRDFTATQAPTLAGNDSAIEIGDPGYWFDTDALAAIDGIRELCEDTWSSVPADEIRTTLIVPDKRTKTAIHSQARSALLRIPGRRSKVSVVDLADYDRASDPPGAYTDVQTFAAATVSITKESGVWYVNRPAGGLGQVPVLSWLRLFFAGDSFFTYAQVGGVMSDTKLQLTAPDSGLVQLEGAIRCNTSTASWSAGTPAANALLQIRSGSTTIGEARFVSQVGNLLAVRVLNLDPGATIAAGNVFRTGSSGTQITVANPANLTPPLLTVRSGDALMWRFLRDENEVLYSTKGVLDYGEAIGRDAISPSAPAILSSRRPAIVCGFIGPSFCVGTTVNAYLFDDDPDLLSKPGQEHPGRKVWNIAEGEWQPARIYRELTANGPVPRANFITHPKWNLGMLIDHGATVGPQMALLKGLRERFPDEDVHLIVLGANGSTMAPATGEHKPNQILNVIRAVDHVAIELKDIDGRMFLGGDFVVTINGVTGLTPSINGQHHNARHLRFGSSANAPPTQWIQIPGRFTGTPAYSGATLWLRPGVWQPSVGELWTDFEEVVKSAYEALLDDRRLPDCRALFSVIGINEVYHAVHNEFGAVLDEMVPLARELLQTRAKPRGTIAELPIVWLNPTSHEFLTDTENSRLAVVRAALAARAANDPYFRVLTVDPHVDWLQDLSPISNDKVHPTFRGYQEIGYRLARQGLDLVPGFTGLHPVDFTPQIPVGGVTP